MKKVILFTLVFFTVILTSCTLSNNTTPIRPFVITAKIYRGDDVWLYQYIDKNNYEDYFETKNDVLEICDTIK